LFKIPSLLNNYPIIRNPHPLKNKNFPKTYHFRQLAELPLSEIAHSQLYCCHSIFVNFLKTILN
jgi:hypothetical protein